jgi:hypothetical protein
MFRKLKTAAYEVVSGAFEPFSVGIEAASPFSKPAQNADYSYSELVCFIPIKNKMPP